METFMGLCNELGVPLAKNKTVGPTNILPFLGYIIDTELMMVLIPFEKIEKLSRLLQSLLVRKKIKRSELVSIVGLMSFCSRAIPSCHRICFYANSSTQIYKAMTIGINSRRDMFFMNAFSRHEKGHKLPWYC
jgi:hypothetical protein